MLRFCMAVSLITGLFLTGCGKETETEQAAGPVTLTFWHYYNDAQKDALDEIVAEYNDTVGKERQITVEAVSLGSIEDITTKVESVVQGSGGEMERPDMFLAYRDMLQEIRAVSEDALLDFRTCYTTEDLDGYYADFLAEGEFGDALYIMPASKSTELLFMNQTVLDAFFRENEAYSAADLQTWESMAEMAEAFYHWTDEKTSQPGDGKALIGIDNFSNYFIVQSNALGSPIYETADDGSVTFHLDKAHVKALFLNYYIPYTKGYYGGSAKYRSDDLRQDTLYGYVGSLASVAYFPQTVYREDGSELEITMGIYPYPYFRGGDKTVIQQGAGIAALDGGEEKNRAIADFIKWISEDKGVVYESMLSYMPASKTGVEAGNWDLIEDENVRKAVTIGVEQVRDYRMVRGFDFEGAYEVRMNLEDYFKLCLAEGRKEYQSYLRDGMTAEEAEAAMQYDEKAEAFYGQITDLFGLN